MGKEKNLCDFCELDIQSDSEFCPRCGTILIDDVFCSTHSDLEALGVCVICAVACCDICGHSNNNVFLCNEHIGYEIYEGMARVFGTSDDVQVQHIKGFLEESGLHPFIYSRKSSPMHLGGTDYSLFRASGDFDGHIINEIKLMVPCSEVLEAETLISEINI